MNWFFPLFIGIGIALISISWGLRQNKKLKRIKIKYASAISIGKYVEEEKTNIYNYVGQEEKELELFISEEKDFLEKEKLDWDPLPISYSTKPRHVSKECFIFS